MKRLLLLLILLLSASSAFGQSTTVTLSVTDTPDSQTWNNGTYQTFFVGAQTPSWPGGAVTITGAVTALSASGTASFSLPDNNTILPSGTQWRIQVCSATLPARCFSSTQTITGVSQTVALTPPSPRFSVPLTPAVVSPITAYADSEISGGWIGFTYYSLTANSTRSCSAVSASGCTTWSSGASSIGAAINVKSLGAFGDTKYATGVTLSRTASTGILPAGSTATVGQLIQCGATSAGTTTVIPFASTNGGQTLPATITSVNGQNFTYNTNPVGSGTPLVDGVCIFGHDDTPFLTSAFNQCKTASKPVVFNTLIQNYPCNVYLPAGGYMISSTPFNETGAGGNTMGVGIIGDGMNTSILWPILGFTNTANAGCGFVLCGFGWGQTYKAFGIELVISAYGPNGIVFANMNVAAIACGNCFMEDVRIADWFNGGLNTVFMLEDVSGAQINHIRIENTLGGATSGGGYQCNVCGTSMYHSFLSNTTQNMSITGTGGRGSGSFFNDHGSLIDEGSITSIINAKGVSFFGTQLMGGANCVSVDATSEVRFSGGYCGTFAGNPGGGGPTVASGGKLWLADAEISANGAGQYCYNAGALGGIIDLGGNQCILAGGATTYKAGSANTQFTLSNQAQTQLGGQQVVNGAVPTGCTITGNGTSTCAFDTGSTDAAGRITITAAGTTTAVGLVSFSFATTYGTNSTNCSANYLSGTGTWAIGAVAPIFITNTTAGASFNINNAGTNLTAASTYKVNYTCYGQ